MNFVMNHVLGAGLIAILLQFFKSLEIYIFFERSMALKYFRHFWMKFTVNLSTVGTQCNFFWPWKNIVTTGTHCALIYSYCYCNRSRIVLLSVSIHTVSGFPLCLLLLSCISARLPIVFPPQNTQPIIALFLSTKHLQ